jgi:hypothetical protein
MDSILDKELMTEDQLEQLVHIIRVMPTLLRIMRLGNFENYEAFLRNNGTETQILSMIRVLTIMEQSKNYVQLPFYFLMNWREFFQEYSYIQNDRDELKSLLGQMIVKRYQSSDVYQNSLRNTYLDTGKRINVDRF